MSFLIKQCQIQNRQSTLDVRLAGDRIADMGEKLSPIAGEEVIDAHGGLLLPGLHDHHIHLVSLAASLASTQLGPPQVHNEAQMIDTLQAENEKSREWLRGIGYHNSVAGDIDRHWLDACIPDRPVRVQHRGGRLWTLNTSALSHLGLMENPPRSTLPSGIEFENNEPSGRLFECDTWLREQLGSTLPCLAAASALLASYGVTGITDTTPSNALSEWDYFERMQREGKLRQTVRMMGSIDLPTQRDTQALHNGEFKVHLLESNLPEFESLLKNIRSARKAKRNLAFHCVTHTELVYALAAIEVEGNRAGDRIEHASITSLEMLSKIKAMGLRVVSQPHFVYERGEQYLTEVDASEQADLYRLRSFINAGVPLAAGSDAPFGSPNPWRAMQSAVSRQTLKGSSIEKKEALTPEMALALYTSKPQRPGLSNRTVRIGSEASLCLLDKPWQSIRTEMANTTVRHTWHAGRQIYSRD